MKHQDTQEISIYQTRDGAIALRTDKKHDTIWANLDQIATLLERDKSVISRHINNIFKEGELIRKGVVAKNAITARDGKVYQVDYFNLDMIISVGYRVNSKTATKFRQRATRTLTQHITKGFTINADHIQKNYQSFLDAVDQVKKLNQSSIIGSDEIMELVKTFATTWFSLDAYDKESFPQNGQTQQDVLLQNQGYILRKFFSLLPGAFSIHS